MLDTVKLCIPFDECKVNSPEIFIPSIRSNIKRYIKYVYNPSKELLKNEKYFPKLTIFKDYNNKNQVIIEFSAPKLVFGNNFEELKTTDFSMVINKLLVRLSELDIELSANAIENAKVFSIHYSKNFELENISSNQIINTIEKLDISKRLDITKTDYKNGGQIVRFHTNSYELAFYDKVADLIQSKISDKRATENENIIQQKLIKIIDNKEILRMEVRLNKSKKIRDIFQKCGIEYKNLIFKQLFNNDISKKVLNYFWNEFIEKSIYLVCQSENDIDVILSKCNLAGFGNNKSLKIAGILSCIKENSYRTIKEKLKDSGFAKSIKDIDLIGLDDNYLLKQFREIRAKLQRMIPLRI